MLIDPMLIYLGHVFDVLEGILLALAIFVGASALCSLAFMGEQIADRGWADKKLKVACAICITVTLLSVVGLVVVPDQETYYGMVAATYVTEDNIDIVKGQGKELIDYIFEKMKDDDE